jgi:hypothetical protein
MMHPASQNSPITAPIRHRARSRFVAQLLLCGVGLHFSAVARADLIFDNGSSNHDDGWEMTQYFEADDFVVPKPTQLSGVKFWNYARVGGFTGSISWDIYANSATNSPGRLVASGSSSASSHNPTGFDLFGTLFEAVTDFPLSITLDTGTYWLALHNGPRNYVTRGMFWAPTGKKKTTGTPSYSRETLSTGPWYSNDYPGMSPDLAFQIFGTFVQLTVAQSWRQQHFGTTENTGNAADTANPDGDGLANLLERAFGTNPTVSQSNVISVSGQTIVPGSPTTRVTSTQYAVDYRALYGRRKDYVIAGLTYTTQFSADLTTWVTSTATPTVIADDGVMQAVTVPYPLSIDGRKPLFFRVAVTQQ